MNTLLIIASYLRSRPLNTVLNVVLLSLGIAVITLLLLVTRQLNDRMESQAKGIDLVLGAKGSPLQLILCNVFHIDFPTGNIKLQDADRLARSRLISQAIPLALGDSYKGHRMVGCSREYPELYAAQLAEGMWWNKSMEVVVGSEASRTLALRVGDTFLSAHGLAEEGHTHEDHRFLVTGILQPTHTVLDNLILTGIESIWDVHESPRMKTDSSFAPSRLVPAAAASDSLLEITSLLIRFRSPMGAVQLPRMISAETRMQAASPAFEAARLFTILGVGVDALMVLGYVLVFISGLSIFIALYNSLRERRYDMAIMRTMGSSRKRLLVLLLLEGIVLTFMGGVVGLMLAHGVLKGLTLTTDVLSKAGISSFVFYSEEWIILAASMGVGMFCALLPAYQAYRTDISRVLSSQ